MRWALPPCGLQRHDNGEAISASRRKIFCCQGNDVAIQRISTSSQVSRAAAGAIATMAFVIPLAMSLSSAPAPYHPLSMLWYRTLQKPNFKPPDWAFPVAWTAIEAGLAVTAYRLLRSPPSRDRSQSLALWAWNVFMIGGWSRLFFKRHQLAVSTVAAASLVVTSAALVREAKKVDTTASRAAIPLFGAVAFATVLTATIWGLNARR